MVQHTDRVVLLETPQSGEGCGVVGVRKAQEVDPPPPTILKPLCLSTQKTFLDWDFLGLGLALNFPVRHSAQNILIFCAPAHPTPSELEDFYFIRFNPSI